MLYCSENARTISCAPCLARSSATVYPSVSASASVFGAAHARARRKRAPSGCAMQARSNRIPSIHSAKAASGIAQLPPSARYRPFGVHGERSFEVIERREPVRDFRTIFPDFNAERALAGGRQTEFRRKQRTDALFKPQPD